VGLSGLLLLLGLAASILELQPYWYPIAGLFAIAFMADALALQRVRSPDVARRIPQALALGVPSEVVLRVTNASSRPLLAELHDGYPADFEAQGMPLAFKVGPHAWADLRYELRPLARGAKRFGAAEVRVTSPLGLLQARRFCGPEQAVRVY